MPVEPNLESMREEVRRYGREKRERLRAERISALGKEADNNRINVNLVNDIYPVPECANPERRESCRLSFKLYCETYFSRKFYLRWSTAHLTLIESMQNSVLGNSGLLACALFRGAGKTSLVESLVSWALLYAHKRFVGLIASTQDRSKDLISSIITELETNELLFEDFPEVCYPIRSLERSYIRGITQHCDGKFTRILYKQGKLVFPTLEGSKSSGAVIFSTSISGAVRGMKHLLSTGEVIRPDLVVLDDPQTDATARSKTSTIQRENVINKAILGLAGPRDSMSAIMPCTVIQKGDLAERFLDNELKPEWQGIRLKLLPSPPKNMELWEKYNQIRKDSLRARIGVGPATEFYRTHQQEMDEGAEISWTERYDPRIQISAIQAAMDLYFKDPISFASEYQNEPVDETLLGLRHDLTLLKAKVIERICGLPRLTAPRDTQMVTAGIDIQSKILYYIIVAWSGDFGGCIVDYGTYPQQPHWEGWTSQNPPRPMWSKDSKTGVGPAIDEGLHYIKDKIFSRPIKIDERLNDYFHVEKCLIDAGWSLSSDTVYNFVKQQETSQVYMPSHGRGIGANILPMEHWGIKMYEIRKYFARILPNTASNNRGRHVTFDTNTWKSLIAERLSVPLTAPNALKLWGEDPTYHETFAEHCASEKAELKIGRCGEVIEWSKADENSKNALNENHLWDCLIMAAVAANINNLTPHNIKNVDGSTAIVPPKVRRVAPPMPVKR